MIKPTTVKRRQLDRKLYQWTRLETIYHRSISVISIW